KKFPVLLTKQRKIMKITIQNLFIALAVFANFNCLIAQGTAFTYQGELNNGGLPANGNYDMTFTLFATNATGVALAGPVTNSTTAVSNGLFTTLIDFGGAPFTNGGNRWLEIAVSTNGANNFVTLTPRQQLTPTPYALYAMTPAGPQGAQGPQGIAGTNG